MKLHLLLKAAAFGLVIAMLGSHGTANAGSIWTTYTDVTLDTSTSAYNTLAPGTFSETADANGTVFVSGNVTSLSTVAQQLPGTATTAYALTVAGNLDFSGTAQMLNGYSAEYAGTNVKSSFDFDASSYGHKGSLVSLAPGSLNATASLLQSQITSASTYFSNQASVDTSIKYSGSNATFTYTGTSPVAYFSITAAQLQQMVNNNDNFYLNLGSATTAVFNVTNIPAPTMTSPIYDLPQINFQGLFTTDQSNILWNFGTYDGNIDISRQFNGAVLAPYAEVTATSQVFGSIWANSINASAEIYYTGNGNKVVQYSGFDPTTVPEPSTFVLAGIGIFFAGVYQWGLRRFRVSRRIA